ncbi:protein of unknown function [Methanoculleus bourgensis]|uniref:DUF4277 domain-containing protein n=1 Tax=Methanoculleus bourgensis TaxID=83986 RepID=A0A0X3BJ15_9EURY|nr:DUF4277 domain-containing protein [Methanoculleus bourgensis]CVK32127.1 protein of unknown function [Methanoculleus bourgensis]
MPLVDGFDDTSILSIGHLGIVAGAYDSLQIADVIDAALPENPPVHLRAHGVPAATRIGANRRDGDQPDEETDPAAYVEMDLLPVPEGAGV